MSKTAIEVRPESWEMYREAAERVGIPVVEPGAVGSPSHVPQPPFVKTHLSGHPNSECCAWVASLFVDGFNVWCYGPTEDAALRKLAVRAQFFKDNGTLIGSPV